MVLETLHSIGLCCIVYIVLPQFKAPGASVVVLAVVLLLPLFDITNLCSNDEKGEHNDHRSLRILAAIGGILMQVFGIAMICYYIFSSDLIGYDSSLAAIFIVSAILVSLKYWETFVVGKKKSRWLPHIKWIYKTRRTRIMFVVNIWKLIITFVSVIVIYSIKAEKSTDGVQSIFNIGTAKLKAIYGGHYLGINDTCQSYVPFVIAIINISITFVCSKAAKAACVIGFQKLCFSLPLIIVPIATVVVLEVLMFHPDILRLGDCDLYFAQWNLGEMEDINDSWPFLVAGLALYLSLVCVTYHIWTSNGIILGKTQR